MESIDFSVRILAPWAYMRAALPLLTVLGAYIRPGPILDLGRRAFTVLQYLVCSYYLFKAVQ